MLIDADWSAVEGTSRKLQTWLLGYVLFLSLVVVLIRAERFKELNQILEESYLMTVKNGTHPTNYLEFCRGMPAAITPTELGNALRELETLISKREYLDADILLFVRTSLSKSGNWVPRTAPLLDGNTKLFLQTARTIQKATRMAPALGIESTSRETGARVGAAFSDLENIYKNSEGLRHYIINQQPELFSTQ